MKYRSASTRKCRQPVEHRRCRATAVNGHDPAADKATGVQYVIEGLWLRLPMLLEFGTTVEADLTNVHGLMQVQVKQRQFADSFMCDLRMQTQSRPNARACGIGRSTENPTQAATECA